MIRWGCGVARGLWGFIRDLFMGNGNMFWDLGRILTFWLAVSLVAAAGWNMYLGQPIDLGPGGFGGGLAGLLTAGAALVVGKEWIRNRTPPPGGE